MSQQKISMPSSGAGITQYFGDSESKMLISPEIVLGVIVFIIVVLMILNYVA